MIKNIVFDIGEVLIGFDYNINQENINVNKLNLANDILIKDEMWKEHLKGNNTVLELIDHLKSNNSNLEKEFKELLLKESLLKYIYEIKENIEILKELSLNYNIYLLSNIVKETYENIKENFEFMKYIKGGVYSFKEHYLKPHKEIYKILLDRYNSIPEETIFIDDKIKNIETACEINMHGIQYKSSKDLQEKLGGILN